MSTRHLAYAIHHGPTNPHLWRLLVILADHATPDGRAWVTWETLQTVTDRHNLAVGWVQRLADGGWIHDPHTTYRGIGATVTLT